MVAWRDSRNGEGRDQYAGATGTFVINLFGHDGNKRSNMTQYMADKGKKGATQDSGKP